MGEVFRALQEEPVQRPVALKCIQAHLAPVAQARFLAEREALARLDHPNIARFYDAGTTEDGRPWLTMELLDGVPLDQYCDHRRLPVDRRIGLVLEVCDALEHAHRRQILHRDLKPSNLLVIEEDGEPIPKVIDFGIAKLLDAAPELMTRATLGGALGTPAYMSPEALAGGPSLLDTRADVYSLGVMLYELLVGHRPFDADRPGLGELVRRVREEDPVNLTAVLRELPQQEREELARQRTTSVAALARVFETDLRWVLARTLEKEPDRRYGSIRELADDLQRVLDHQPILARPLSALYRLGKLIRRRRGAVAAAAVALLGVAAGAAGLATGMVRARAEARSAQEALLEAREVSDFLVGLFQGADPTSEDGRDLSVGELLDRGAEQVRDRLADHPAARVRLLRTLADVWMARGRDDQAELMLREAASLAESALPAGHAERAEVLGSLGVLHVRRQEWVEAERAFEAAVERLDPDADPENWALKRHNLGVAVYRQNRLDEAEAYFLAALEVRRSGLAPDHPHLARSYNALGALLSSRGRPAEAEPYLRAAVELRERTLGVDHPDLAKALVNLARVQDEQGRTAEAIETVERALRIEEAALGPEHPDLVVTLQNLARFREGVGELEGASAALTRSVALQRAAGADGVSFERDLVALGHLQVEAGNLDAAEALFREAVTLHPAADDPRDPDATLPCQGLALVAWRRGELDRAEREALEIQRLRAAHVGDGRWAAKGELYILAGVARDRGDTARAAAYARELLAAWDESTRHPKWRAERIREEMESLVVADASLATQPAPLAK
jgi:non-specific serine/threonine protein kinase/serine/threonine-protein kinase